MMLETMDPWSIAIGVGIGFVMAYMFLTTTAAANKTVIPVNPDIDKDNPKVGTLCTVQDIEDLIAKSPKGKVSYCRCWRSKKFPYCDGAHRDYNSECKDNTGPLTIVKERKGNKMT